MQLCRVTEKNLSEVLELVKEVFDEFEAPEYEAMGVETFYHFIRYENIKEMMQKAEMLIYAAYDGSQLAGVIALRGEQHISLLFVKKQYQRQGVAKKLFAMIRSICEKKELEKKVITVNSSPYAVEVYRCLGFQPLAEEQTKDGIRFTPMKYRMEEIK